MANHRKPASIPGIYLITNIVNGKVYVGQAKNINARWHHHRHLLHKGTHNNPYLQRAWDRLGADAFVFSVVVDLSGVPRSMLITEQARHEALVFAQHPDTYNLLQPGLEGQIAPPDTLAKLSVHKLQMWEKLRANPERMADQVNRSHAWRRTDEGKQLQSEWFTELWKQPEFRATLSRKSAEKWKKPGYLEKHNAQLKAAWSDPAKREARMAGIKAAWADPEVRAARLAAGAATRARKKLTTSD